MKLFLKFNLAFVAIFLVGLGNAVYISSRVLEQNARDETLQSARLLLESALAAHDYTSTQIQPLLETQMKYTFLPQSVPDFSAVEIFQGLNKRLPDYLFKEVALNPINPRDRASAWETHVVNQFQSDAERAEIIGEHDAETGRVLYVARPIRVSSQACLACHGSADTAPPTLVARYGASNGFGWTVGETVGAMLVTVPTDVPARRAATAFRTFMLALAGVFVLMAFALNIMLYEMVIRPIARLSALADRVSMGDMNAPDFRARSRDEIGVLAASLNRLKRSLTEAMKMLNQSDGGAGG